MTLINNIDSLAGNFQGDIFTDTLSLTLYSTDASAYKEKPLAVTRPKTIEDIKLLIQFAKDNNTFLIPRTAGTSLAGQVVGSGIVVDVSKYFTDILDVNTDEKWVRVQPGVVRDELNKHLAFDNLFFAPETSTSNRCMIGGMIGNNACGSHSLIYGSTRDHLLEVKALLSDGSEAHFKDLTIEEFKQKCSQDNLEGEIYRNIEKILSDKEIQKEIEKQYPDKSIRRRNTGYALDILLKMLPFSEGDILFNFSKLIAGSEGTLLFITEAKLNLEQLPPKNSGLVCVHFNTLEEAFHANLIALKYHPGAVELIDKIILDCTKSNIEQAKNRFFLEGDPAAIICVEFERETREEIDAIRDKMVAEMKQAGLGYSYPILYGNDINKVWNLRKAGLGLLSNIPGDAKPVPVIEDTAVKPEVLPDYIKDFQAILKTYNLRCVYYAHIATGELHLRPVLNLKEPKDVELFHTVALEVSKLVKKYNGSLSGEHGDGRLRGEFIPLMLGDKIYQILKDVKNTWDPNGIFNKGKIVDTPKMNTSLRYEQGKEEKKIETIFRFDEAEGYLRLAEKCNGSGDCRKSHVIGGTMCPSYQATKDENATTRARANTLREYITKAEKDSVFNQKEIYEMLDLCLSCKGCKSECPSNVDMAKLKAEFLQHYYDSNRVPLRSWLIANIAKLNALAMPFSQLYNAVVSSKVLSNLMSEAIGFAKERNLPKLHKHTLKKWIRKNLKRLNKSLPEDASAVYVFVDEFTNYNDVGIGIKAIEILNKLGYRVLFVNHEQSGRTYISKGLIRKAKQIANNNVSLFKDLIKEETPLLGIEPSAILTFRDEYPDLVDIELKSASDELAKNVLLFEEFICNENKKKPINQSLFTQEKKEIKLHGHCQQKSVASTKDTISLLSIPKNYSVKEIPSGCCGMAGSFGYEKEHYNLSMKVGELVLFPEIRKTEESVLISAPGTSCRHQIKDGTDKDALHPIEIFYNAFLSVK